MKVQTSEYCAVGHPDRLCDYAVSYILDRYQNTIQTHGSHLNFS